MPIGFFYLCSLGLPINNFHLAFWKKALIQYIHFISRCPVRERAASLLSTDGVSEAVGNGGFPSVEHLAMDTGLRFRMPTQQKKNADVLLQEMFEDELEEDDIGPKDLDDLDELEESEELINERSGRRKLTFLTVDANWRAFPVAPVM